MSSDVSQAIGILASMLQAATRATEAALRASQAISAAHRENRNLTDQEWLEIDAWVADQRQQALDS